jgi:sporulation protein YlmC with PRC-barrel domain
MRKLPIAAVAALALMTGVAAAQNSTSPSIPARPAPGATTAPAAAPMQKEAAINPLSQEDVSKIEGTTVYGSDDGKIGHVSTALMDPASKKIDRLVVTAGGVLGVGGHRVAIPVEQLSWDADKGAFKLNTTLAELKQMPEWVEGQQTMTGSSLSPRNDTTTTRTTTTPPAGAGDSTSR